MLLVVDIFARGRGARKSQHRFGWRRSDQEFVFPAINGGRIMVRKMVIVLAAAAAVIAGSTFDASAARMGGGAGHGGFGRMGGFGHAAHGGFGRMSGFGRAAIAHPGHFGRFAVFHPRAFHANRFAFGHRFAFRHHRFSHRRFAVFAAFPYANYDSCYERVWTRLGWRWTYVCDY